MKIMTRIAAGALAIGCIAGAGVATSAAPAEALTTKAYSISRSTGSACSDALNSAMRVKRVMGFRVHDVKGCTQWPGGGYWNASFLYSW
ncbi:hypothetical protein GCM10027033_24290 [Leucobacter ruminantium]